MSNMVINNNLLAINAHRALKLTGGDQSKAVEKLSSGLRINRAADDAAGLAISEKMRAQIRGLNQASRNAQDGISLIQTAEGAINETHAILQRMRELAVQAANGTYQDEDRELIQKEVEQLIEELDDITVKTEFNKMKLVDGSLSGGITFHVGPNEEHAFSVNMVNASAEALEVADVDISTQSGAQKAITTIENAIIKVAEFRAELGAVQNRLEHTIKNIDISAENLQAAESRIRDTDMAKEMMNFVRTNILQQAATSMLAHANQAPQMVLHLLR